MGSSQSRPAPAAARPAPAPPAASAREKVYDKEAALSPPLTHTPSFDSRPPSPSPIPSPVFTPAVPAPTAPALDLEALRAAALKSKKRKAPTPENEGAEQPKRRASDEARDKRDRDRLAAPSPPRRRASSESDRSDREEGEISDHSPPSEPHKTLVSSPGKTFSPVPRPPQPLPKFVPQPHIPQPCAPDLALATAHIRELLAYGVPPPYLSQYGISQPTLDAAFAELGIITPAPTPTLVHPQPQLPPAPVLQARPQNVRPNGHETVVIDDSDDDDDDVRIVEKATAPPAPAPIALPASLPAKPLLAINTAQIQPKPAASRPAPAPQPSTSISTPISSADTFLSSILPGLPPPPPSTTSPATASSSRAGSPSTSTLPKRPPRPVAADFDLRPSTPTTLPKPKTRNGRPFVPPQLQRLVIELSDDDGYSDDDDDDDDAPKASESARETPTPQDAGTASASASAPASAGKLQKKEDEIKQLQALIARMEMKKKKQTAVAAAAAAAAPPAAKPEAGERASTPSAQALEVAKQVVATLEDEKRALENAAPAEDTVVEMRDGTDESSADHSPVPAPVPEQSPRTESPPASAAPASTDPSTADADANTTAALQQPTTTSTTYLATSSTTSTSRLKPYSSPFSVNPALASHVPAASKPDAATVHTAVHARAAARRQSVELGKRVCKFEIPGGGVCRDKECEAVHLVDFTPTDADVLAELSHAAGGAPQAVVKAALDLGRARAGKGPQERGVEVVEQALNALRG